MARKTTEVLIEDEGRDFGKTFVIREMPADKGERWAIRALLALANAGIDLPAGATNAGFAGFAAVGLEAFGKISFEVAEPLLNEMMDCVQIKMSGKVPARALINGEGGDIEEIATRFKLRMAVMSLHLNFSKADTPPNTALPLPPAGAEPA